MNGVEAPVITDGLGVIAEMDDVVAVAAPQLVAPGTAADDVLAGDGGQIGQMSGGGRQQAHHLNRTPGGDEELPLARSVSEASAEPCVALLQLLGR